MKISFQNHKGYALILVLLTITVIGILIPPLVGSVLNSAMQNNLTEEKNQLTKISEMGMVYFRNFKDKLEAKQREELQNNLEEFIENKTYSWELQLSNGSITKEDIKQEVEDEKKRLIANFETEIRNMISSGPNNGAIECFETVDAPGPIKFTRNDEFQFSFKDVCVSSGDYNIDLKYTSVALKLINNAFEQTEPELLRFEFGDVNVPIDINDGSDPDSPEYNESCPTSGNYTGNCIFDSTIDVRSGLIINGDVIFTKDVTVSNGGSIWIYGNATFENDVKIDAGGRLFIEGENGEAVEVCFAGGSVHNGGRIFVNGERIESVPEGCN
ncbi:MAG: hypothetical protein ACQEWV_06485 [Bacillota bacterium]